MDFSEHYAQELLRRGYQTDVAQQRAVLSLQACYKAWLGYKTQNKNPIKRLLTRAVLPPKGVYLWGGVGRGKSFLMDCFYATVPIHRKLRVHFHEFMRDVHHELQALKGTSDPLNEVSRRIAQKYRLICFDEFHISDIADAMILHRLLQNLFKHKVQFVMTSNYPPDSLYPDGLHRERLLPAIKLLKQNLEILNVDAGIDYRKETFSALRVYHSPLGDKANHALRHMFAELSGKSPDENPILHIEQRELHALRRTHDVVWFDFYTLCGGPRSQNDYLEIAQRFHTVILSDIPQMSPRLASAARRFTWLIDVLYDQKTKLVASAAVPPEKLYTEGPMAQEFQRTVSRLIEMQSEAYLAMQAIRH